MADVQRITLDEVVRHFEELEDPRCSINRKHPLVRVVVIAVMAVLAGASRPTAIARWAALKEEFLVTALHLPEGVPGKDVFRCVLLALRPEAFRACFGNWLESLRAFAAAATGVEQPVLAVDGKTSRRSHDRKNGLGALHSVTVWASEFGLSLGQVSPAPRSPTRSRRSPKSCGWWISRGRSSPSTRWGRRRRSPPRSSTARGTTCWR